MAKKKTWKEKLLNNKNLPRVEKISYKMEKIWGKGSVAIPSPKEIDDIMRIVPEGKVITIDQIRSFIAKKYNATIGCPITVGMFVIIAANASLEDEANGIKDITPYWRTLKTGGFLNEKYPGGVMIQKERLEKEGHIIISKGKKFFVLNYKDKMFQL